MSIERALVIGATSGVGRATATALTAAGARVVTAGSERDATDPAQVAALLAEADPELVVVAGVYLGRSELFDTVVHERVVTAPATTDAAERGNVRVAAGRFEAVRHDARGTATAIRLATGRRMLTLTGFSVANGPDLRLYLVAGPARTEADVRDRIDLGGLKGNKGDQQYVVPRRVDLGRYRTAVIWCRAFSVLFARAPLT